MRFFLLLAGLLLLTALPAKATHLLGGQMTFKYLSGNDYEIELIVMRDDAGQAPLDTQMPIAVYGPGATLLQVDSINLVEDSLVIPPAVDSCTTPPSFVYQIGVYRTILTMDPGTTGLTVVTQRCCRPEGILNIDTPEEMGWTFTVDIPPTPNQANSSPQIDPSFYTFTTCNQQPFTQALPYADPDGDSLVFSLATPFLGASPADPLPATPLPPPYTNLLWEQNYSATNQLNTTIPLTIDAATGTLSVVPEVAGKFLIGYRIDEYRNGTLIGTYLVEGSILVYDCLGIGAISVENDSNLCTTVPVQFESTGNWFAASPNFTWDFGDPMTTGDTANIEDPQYTYADTGQFTVRLISALSTCADTTFKTIQINQECDTMNTHVETWPTAPNLHVYPNPCTDQAFRISGRPNTSLATAQVELVDLAGKQVPIRLTRKSTELLVNCTVQPGIYLCCITFSDGTRLVKRVMMQ